MTIINRSKRRRHNSLYRFTNETYGLNVNAIETRRLERNATFSVNQRMILVLILALVALLFLMAAQPEGEASALPSLEIKTGNDPASFSQVGLENALSGPDQANPSKPGISPVFTDEVRYWESNILRWAEGYDLDPNLVAIIMQVESCGDPQAASYAGAQGLFQVMPFHFVEGEDSLDPDTNARRGINYFVGRLEQTGGDIGRSYAGYNGGHVAAATHWDEWAHETQSYYIWTTGLYDDIQSGLTESPTLQQWLQAGGASLCQQAADRLGL
jgi:hypothetical protein